MSVQPVKLLEALDGLLTIYPEDHVHGAVPEFVLVHCAGPEAEMEWLFDPRPTGLLFNELDPEPRTLELFLELQDAASEGFTLGELYDALTERLIGAEVPA